MVSLSRYKPVGWRYESHKHALAARGIKTRYNATKVFPSEADEKGRILCPECNLPLNVKRPLVDKKCNCNRPWFAKKPMLTKDEFAEQIHAERPTLPFSEVKRLAAHRRLAALSDKEQGRGEYFSKQMLEKSDWKEIQKVIKEKKKADPTVDERSTLFEEIWNRKKPEDLPLFVHEVSNVPYSGKADIETKKTKVEVKSVGKVVKLAKQKKSMIVEDDDQPKKKKRVVLEHKQDDEWKRLKAEFEKTKKFKEVNK